MSMAVYMNKFQENYNEEGKVTGAELGLYGNNSDGEYISANLVVSPDELGKKEDGTAKTFDDVTTNDVKALAKQKLIDSLNSAK